jgi:hypothetical protein
MTDSDPRSAAHRFALRSARDDDDYLTIARRD